MQLLVEQTRRPGLQTGQQAVGTAAELILGSTEYINDH
jgi:hypothetical protein